MSKQNNQRSDAKNPNNPAHKAAQDNRANQLNPNHAPTKGGGAGATENSPNTKQNNGK